MKATAVVAEDPIPLSPGTRFRAAMILAMATNALQIFVFPLFAEGALSPADDVLDFAVAAILVRLRRLALGISACIRCRTRARSRFGSVLDYGGCALLCQVEAIGNRTSLWASGGRRRVQIFLGMGRSAHRGENVNE